MEVNNPKYIIIHCTDVSYKIQPNQFDSVNNYHRDVRRFPVSSLGYYVGYHRLIDNGTNIQCRKDGDEGAHCNQRVNGVSLNFQSLGVCVSFDGDVEPMKDKDYLYLQKQVWDWQDKYKIPNENVKFHRHFAKDKTCPGSLIKDEWLVKLLKREVLPTESCTAEREEIKAKNKYIQWLLEFIS